MAIWRFNMSKCEKTKLIRIKKRDTRCTNKHWRYDQQLLVHILSFFCTNFAPQTWVIATLNMQQLLFNTPPPPPPKKRQNSANWGENLQQKPQVLPLCNQLFMVNNKICGWQLCEQPCCYKNTMNTTLNWLRRSLKLFPVRRHLDLYMKEH